MQGAAREVGVHPETLKRWVKSAGVQVRTNARHRVVTDEDRDRVVEAYLRGDKVADIVADLGFPGKVDLVYSTLRARGIKRRFEQSSGMGRKRPTGSVVATADGYVVEKVGQNWPFLKLMPGQGDGTWIRQHRLVMAEHLGRALRPSEQVHHIDGDRTNNDISNLQLRHGAHGTGVALCCGSCGSTNLVPAELS